MCHLVKILAITWLTVAFFQSHPVFNFHFVTLLVYIVEHTSFQEKNKQYRQTEQIELNCQHTSVFKQLKTNNK